MKKQLKRFGTALAALMLCLTLVCGALADGIISDLFAIGRDLIFATENVTISGKATFALKGEPFREANIQYRQDGVNSFYDLTLLNPKTGVVNGYTIIANGEDVFVMEKYISGFYRSGTCDPQSTLVRRTTLLENLLKMAELLAGQMELALGDAISATDTESGRTINIRLNAAQAEGLINTGLNLAAEYIVQRYFDEAVFDRRYDAAGRYPQDRISYISTAAYLMDTTEHYALDALDVSIDLDKENRVTGLKGQAALYAVDYDAVSRKLDITLDLTLSDYGSTKVDTFNPSDYGVVSYMEWAENYYGRDAYGNEETMLDYYFNRAVNIVEACGYPVSGSTNASCASYDNFADVLLEDPEKGVAVSVEFDKARDQVLCMQDTNAPWSDGERKAPEGLDKLLPACINCAFTFLNAEHPDAGQIKLQCEGMITLEDGTVYVILEDLSSNYVYLVVEVQPEMRVVYYTCMMA